MKIQQLVIAVVVSTLFIFLLDGLWYAVLMKDYFTPMPNAKPQPEYGWLVLGILIYSFAFVKMYVMGVDPNDTKVSQGLKFGLWAILLAWLPMAFVWYSLLDGGSMTEYIVDMVYRLAQMLVLGVIVAYLTGMPVDHAPMKEAAEG